MKKLLLILLVLCSAIACYATSIVFPGFGTPLIHEGKIYAHHVNGHKIICFDASSKSIKWESKLDQKIDSTWIGLTNEIVVVDYWGRGLCILEADTGELREKDFVKGHTFGVAKNGQVFCEYWETEPIIHCYSYKKNKELWSFNPQTPNSNISSTLCGEYLFIFVSPRSIETSGFDSKEETKIKEGSNEIICVKASDGSPLWREKVPLSKAGFGVTGHVKEGKKYLLCVSDNTIRLLDKTSAKILKRYETTVDIDGADLWGDESIVMCLGGIDVDIEGGVRTIRVIDIVDFRILSEFQINKTEVASVQVVGNVLLLGSLYREMGVDLVKKKTIWTAYQRHQTIHNGLIYYGEYDYDEDTENEHKILGVCNPITGDNEILYSELISYTKVKPYHIFTAVGVILVIGTVTMFFLKTKKRHA